MKYYKDYMREALQLAKIAAINDEVPVASIIVYKNQIIASNYNQVENLKNATAHAEMLVINEACKVLGQKYLNECEIYVTIEPCPMCAGAIVMSKMKTLIFGASNYKSGCSGSIYMLTDDKSFNHQTNIISGILEKECAELLKLFFKSKK